MFKNTIKFNKTLGLAVLAILSLSVLALPFQNKTYAQTSIGTLSNPSDSSRDYNSGGTYGSGRIQRNNYQPIYTPAPVVYVNPAPAPAPTTQVVYSSTVNKNAVATKTAPRTIVRAKTTPPVTETPADNLTASAISGSNTFMPSSIIEWIFLAISILLIVLLARKIFGGEKKYHATPLKHD